MKKLLLSVSIFSMALFGFITNINAQQQLPDGSFEIGGLTNSTWSLVQGEVFKDEEFTIQNTPYHATNGSYFILLHTDTVTLPGQPQQVLPSMIGTEAPYTDRPAYVRFDYSWLNAAKTDSFGVIIEFHKTNPNDPNKPVIVGTTTLAGGGGTLPWKRFSAKMNYLTSDIPDSVLVIITSGIKSDKTSKATYTQGTSFLIDNITFQNSDPNLGIDIGTLDNTANNLSIHPNPFVNSAHFNFTLANTSSVSLKIMGLNGQTIATLIDEQKGPGNYDLQFDGSTLKPGLYFYEMVQNGGRSMGKIVISR